MHTKTHKEKILSCNKSTNAQTNKQRIEARSKSKQGLCTQLAVYIVHQSIFGDDWLFF